MVVEPEPLPALSTVTAPPAAPHGAVIEVACSRPGAEGEFVGLTAPGRTDHHRFAIPTAVADGNP